MRLIWIQIFATALLSLAEPVTADIRQQISVNFDPTPFPGPIGDSNRDTDSIEGKTDADIDRVLVAAIAGPSYEANGSVGTFGNYGVFGSTSVTGELSAQVFIRADVEAPPFGSPRAARANFIIDGGSVFFVAGPASSLEFNLTLSADGRTVFHSGFNLLGSPGGSSPTINFSGEDIGAVLTDSTVEIPFSGQSANLGVLNPGQSINFEYQLNIVANINDFAEIARFSFQDPLTIEPPPVSPDQLRPTVSPVPLPSGVWMMLSVLSLATFRLKTRKRLARLVRRVCFC